MKCSDSSRLLDSCSYITLYKSINEYLLSCSYLGEKRGQQVERGGMKGGLNFRVQVCEPSLYEEVVTTCCFFTVLNLQCMYYLNHKNNQTNTLRCSNKKNVLMLNYNIIIIFFVSFSSL